MTNLILALSLAMSPKVASHQPAPVNVPLIGPAPITVSLGWFNHQSLLPYVSNVLAIAPLAGGATNFYAIPVTNRAQVTAPSNSVSIMIAAIGANGITSDFAGPVTNNFATPQSGPPLTNVQYVIPCFSTDLLNWQQETNMAWRWTQPGYWRLLTSTNL